MLAQLWPVLVISIEFLSRLGVVCYILLKQKGSSTTRLTWIIVVLTLPVVGIPAYILIGEVKLGHRRRRMYAEIVDRVETPLRARRQLLPRPPIPDRYKTVSQLAEAASHNTNMPRAGHRLQLIGDTDVFIHSLVEDIDRAKHHCHILVYIFLTDHSSNQVAEALMRAAARGVACRLLVDAVGSRSFYHSDLRLRLQHEGVEVVEAMPVNPLRIPFSRVDLRNHRKIIVIDGVIGYAGSQNIADAEFAIKEKYAPWVDTMLRIEGPCVEDLQILFLEDWFLDTSEWIDGVQDIEPPIDPDGVTLQVLGTGPTSYHGAMRQLTQAMIHSAREEILLTTPYFVPDDATQTAICTAALRGLAVTIVVPQRNDSPLVAAASRSFYDSLLEAGVRIYEFKQGLLHAKTTTIDRELAFISSANLDRRSFELNLEVSVVVYDSDFASQLRFLQHSYVDRSDEVNSTRWKRRGIPRRLMENAIGMLSPLL